MKDSQDHCRLTSVMERINHVALLILVYTVAGYGKCWSCTSSESWDIFIFAQEWPVGTCVDGKEKHHTCKIPSYIHNWSIHGLWPSQPGTEEPTNCNDSLVFNITVLQNLIPQLMLKWPNLYTDTNSSSFWEHEWYKHGTCATSLPATGDQHKYFAKNLELKLRFDAGKILSNQRIFPSWRTVYKLQDFEEAIKRELSVNAWVIFAYDQKTKRCIIYELKICLNKTFDPIDCYNNSKGSGKRSSHHHKNPHKASARCPEREGIVYPPIPNTFTAKPHPGNNVGDSLMPRSRSILRDGSFRQDNNLLLKDLQSYLNRRKIEGEIYVSYMEEKRGQ